MEKATETLKQADSSNGDLAFCVKHLVIPDGGFRCIVVDPPWPYGKWGVASDRPNQTKARPLVKKDCRFYRRVGE